MKCIKLQTPDNPLFNGAKKIIAEINSYGKKAYIVGGAVRNLLLNKAVKDIDIVSNCDIDTILKIFPSAELVGAVFGVVIVKMDSFAYEIAACRAERNYMDGRHPTEIKFTESFEVDSYRRDFTVNALLFDVLNGEVVDYHDGISDLNQGIIRTVGEAEKRFSEDYLRILRAIRFAGSLGFSIETQTFEAIQKLSCKCSEIAKERLKQELDLMLLNSNREKTMRLLQKSGVMEFVLPEIFELESVEQNPIFHPEGDVFEHTMRMLRHAVLPSLNLLWSVILHDVGKKETFSRDEKGIHFYSHEVAGAELAEKIMMRLKFSNESIAKIKKAILNHMRFANVPDMRSAKVLKMIGDENFALELELNRLDCISSHGDMTSFRYLLDKIVELDGNIELPKPWVTGKDLIQIGYKSGVVFSKILSCCYEAQLNKEIACKDEAIEYILKKFPLN